MQFYDFLSVFGTFAHKVAQTWFVLHETWHTTLFGIYYCIKMVKIKNHSHMLKLRVQYRFYWFLSIFGTFAHKVGQKRFVLHKTCYTTVFGIYYCVEVVRIKNYSHMQEITR